jgi:hypothetical protein
VRDACFLLLFYSRPADPTTRWPDARVPRLCGGGACPAVGQVRDLPPRRVLQARLNIRGGLQPRCPTSARCWQMWVCSHAGQPPRCPTSARCWQMWVCSPAPAKHNS